MQKSLRSLGKLSNFAFDLRIVVHTTCGVYMQFYQQSLQH